MHIKTVILLNNFSFGLINFFNLSTTFFIQRFEEFFYFFIKVAFFNVCYSWGQRFFYIYGPNHLLRLLESFSPLNLILPLPLRFPNDPPSHLHLQIALNLSFSRLVAGSF